MPKTKIKPFWFCNACICLIYFRKSIFSIFWLVSKMALVLFFHTEWYRADSVCGLPGHFWAGECSSKHLVFLQGIARKQFPCLFLTHRPGLRAILFLPGIHSPLIVKERALKTLWIGRCGSKLQIPHPVGCLQNPALFSTHQLCFSNLPLHHSANWDQPLTILSLCLILSFYHFCRKTFWKLLWPLSIWTITPQCLSKRISP